MSGFWDNKKVTVTGGGGFIGSHLCEALCGAGAIVTSAGTSEGHLAKSAYKDKIRFLKTDLFDYRQVAENFKGQDMIMHLAARVGGIEYNMKFMAEVYADNLLMLSAVTKGIMENRIQEALYVSSACVYPHDAVVPTPETEGFRSDPEETNEGYGWAKRSLELAARFLRKYKGVRVAVVRPYNAYGPRDKFDPKHSHVVAALINKVYHSVDGTIQVWGSGNQTRTLLYVKDAVRGMMLAAEKYPEADPINLGNDREYKISEIVEAVIRQSGMKIKPVYDLTKPEGYTRRSSLNKMAREKTGFEAVYDLERGLKETIEYYLEHIQRNES